MQTIDPSTNETIFIVGTEYVSLEELLDTNVNEKSNFYALSFCIKNMDETKTLLIKSMFQDWK
jgi:hypothetical protein